MFLCLVPQWSLAFLSPLGSSSSRAPLQSGFWVHSRAVSGCRQTSYKVAGIQEADSKAPRPVKTMPGRATASLALGSISQSSPKASWFQGGGETRSTSWWRGGKVVAQKSVQDGRYRVAKFKKTRSVMTRQGPASPLVATNRASESRHLRNGKLPAHLTNFQSTWH